jgi:uncharacterized protein RhaS with RHS repeats
LPDKTRYLHYDNLGSIDTIIDGQGNIVERMAYTAFGERVLVIAAARKAKKKFPSGWVYSSGLFIV